MAANTAPIFLKAPRVSFTLVSAANTALDGTGTLATDIYSLFTADATNGSKVEDITIAHKGSNIATVMRFFVNNGATNGTSTNNVLVHEESIAANTLSQTAKSVPVIWRAGLVLPAGYRILVTIGTGASTAFHVSAVGGDY